MINAPRNCSLLEERDLAILLIPPTFQLVTIALLSKAAYEHHSFGLELKPLSKNKTTTDQKDVKQGALQEEEQDAEG